MKLSKKLALSTYLVSIVGLNGSLMANGLPAADCCDQVTELDKRVKRLEEKAVEGDTKKIYLTGHINRAITWIDNGVQSNTAHVDNDNWSSRMSIVGTADYNDDLSFGLRTTLMFRTNSTIINQPHDAQTAGGAETGTIRARHAEVFMVSKKMGTLTVGHGDMPSKNTHFGTHLSSAFNFVSAYTMMESAPFQNKVTGGAVAGGAATPIISAYAFNPGDSSSISGRADRIMYTTPTWYGFSMGAAHAYHFRGDLWDLGAKFSGKFGGWKLSARAGLARNQTREAGETGAVGANGTGVEFDHVSGSIGVLAPFSITGKEDTGIALRASGSHRDYKGVNHKNGRAYIGSLSYIDMFTSMGMTALEAGYSHHTNMTLVAAANQQVVGKAWRVGVQQNIDKVGTELYASYANLKLKIKNLNQRYRAHDVVLVGARVKF